jgi:hypothetical protein
MISDRRLTRRLRWPLLTLVATVNAHVMAAGGLAVDSVKVSETDNAAQIEILFNCPNRYLDHYPQGETDILQINLLRMEQCSSLRLRSDRQEVDTPDDSALAGLASIEYESQREDDAVLRIRFDHPVRAVVGQSSDQRILSITVETVHPVTEPQTGYMPSVTLAAVSSGSAVEDFGSGVALGNMELSEAQLVSLMGEGEAAILQENYSRAIQIYTRVLRATENAYTPALSRILSRP